MKLDNKRYSGTIFSVFLIIGDFLALVAAFVIGYILRVKIDDRPVVDFIPARTFLEIFLYLLPFWLLIFALLGLYNNELARKRFKEIGLLFVGSFVGLLFVIGYDFVVNEPVFPSRLVPVYGFVFGFALLVFFRTIARTLRRQMFKKGYGLRRAVVVGTGKLTDSLLRDLNNSSGYRVVSLVGDKRSLKKHGVKTYSSVPSMLESLDSSSVDEIIQTELFEDRAVNDQLLSYAQTNHLNYRFTPSNSDLLTGSMEVELFSGLIPVVKVDPTPLLGWGSVVKRIFDVVVSFMLLLLLVPLLIILFLIIKISDPKSPVLFRQKRLSRHGREVGVYKIRSHNSAFHGLSPEQAFAKIGKPELAKQYRKNGDQLDNDPRISRMGALLRKTSLDELPQLFNVLRGDISLVGPRALVPEEIDVYPQKHLILSVKSGITGLAQVSGRGDISFEKRRRLDVYYVRNWTFGGDLIILLKTLRIVVNGKGARK